MAFYLVSLPDFPGVQRKSDVKNMVVEADSSAIAKALAAAKFQGDSDWNAATTTDLAGTSPADLTGWTYRLRVGGADPGDAAEVDVSYVGVASDVIDDVGDALTALLADLDATAGSTYTGASNTLLVAEGASDALGDRTLKLEVYPPGMESPLAAMVGTVTHQGLSSADLKVVLTGPTKIPNVAGAF